MDDVLPSTLDSDPAVAQPPLAILVLGMHRSGTSALTRTLSLLGAGLPGNLIPPKPDNKAGFWESADVQDLNDRILIALGSRWDDWRPLPLDALPAHGGETFLDEAAAMLHAAFAQSTLLVLKDPRICRMLPFWRTALERVGARIGCVLSLRSPQAVAASLAQRNGLSEQTGHMLWMRHLLDAERDSRTLPRAFVEYDALLDDWRAAVTGIQNGLGIHLPIAAEVAAPKIEDFLRKNLRHHTVAPSDRTSDIEADATLHALDVLSTHPDDEASLERLDRVREAFDRTCAATPPQAGPFGVPLLRSNGMPLAQIPPSDAKAAAALRMSPAAAAHARAALDVLGSPGQFSVIMPTWNRCETLPRAIDSVLAQSLPPLELLICDDGSTDDTAAMIRSRYAQALGDGRIRFLPLEHRGVSAARNAGLREAKGAWIAYLDSDNLWHPDYLLMMAAALVRDRHRRTAYACEHVHDVVRQRDFIRWLPFNWPRLLMDSYIDINIFAHHRDVFTDLGGFDESLGRLEDWELILRYTRLHPPQFIQTVLCDYYLDRPDHLTLTASLDLAKETVRRKFPAPAERYTAKPACLLVRDGHGEFSQAGLMDAVRGMRVDLTLYDVGTVRPVAPADAPARRPANVAALVEALDADARDAAAWSSALQWAEVTARDVHWESRLDTELRRKDAKLHKLEKDLGESAKKQTQAMDRLRAQFRASTLTLLSQRRALLQRRCPPRRIPPLPPVRCYGATLLPHAQLRLWRAARRLLASGLFDPLWYLQTSPDVALAGGNPVWHWLLRGWQEGRQPNPLFNARWYIDKYADVARAGCDPLQHYLNFGAAEGRDPGPLFSTRWYLEQNPDVASAGANPLGHYLVHGQREGRSPCRWFDCAGYVALNPDVRASNLPALEHYLLAGGREGRQSGAEFDAGWYMETYPDVPRSGVHPLVHYLTHGASEGHRPGPRKKSLSNARTSVAPNVSIGSPQAQALQPGDREVLEARELVAEADIGLFSVVMPTWNRAACIGRAIDSVLAQSYTQWELIVCDDGSTDNTEGVIRERYASQLASGHLRYLRLDHAGVSAARNAGLHAAKGRWIAYLDSDNSWRPQYLLMAAAAYAARPERRAAYACLHVRDTVGGREFIRCRPFDFSALLARNYIDLNVFSHHRDVFGQLGGFDESLRRLVDWDLVLRYTRLYEPQFVPYALCDYHIDKALNHITHAEPLVENERAVRRKFAPRVVAAGAEPLRLAYVLWDWPALSQTFVLEELRELRRREIDVRVYYAAAPDKAARDLPDVHATRVADADALAEVLVADGRNWIHSHFAYPAAAKLAWPAAEKAGIAFSFMPHAVDIFHRDNRARNRIAEMTRSALCVRVMVHGEFHHRFLVEQGVPADKVVMTPQAVNTAPIRAQRIDVRKRAPGEALRVLGIARFIEKKGLEYLVEAAARLAPGTVEIRIHGYGPLAERLGDLIRTRGLHERVRLCDSFEGTEALRTALQWADVFCLPCVEAENGDADGMPTTFFEAMAAGVPCIAGAVSAVPDFITDGVTGFLVPPRDVDALARTLERVARMPSPTLAAVAQAAQRWTDAHLGTCHTVDTLLDCCARPPLDIFMVTYHRDGHGDWTATERAIRSVLERTTTPMVLTIVDNGSDHAFLDRLRQLAQGDERIRLVPLDENRMCGPASNVALEMARSEFAFYVCSNEGYIVRTGWERPCLRYMRNHADTAISGHLVASPAWPDGRGYIQQEWFKDFRNPQFAHEQPDREFFHVQGGLYALRRETFLKEGGFSERRPQAQTDVEYSYFLESKGYQLGDIPELVVLSNKTRPGLEAFVDENTVAVHPVFDNTVASIDAWTQAGTSRCNICGWTGDAPRADDGVSFDCPQCASSPRDRAVFRWLAGSNLHHRGKVLDARGLGNAARKRLGEMFTMADKAAEIHIPDALSCLPSHALGITPALPSTAHQPDQTDGMATVCVIVRDEARSIAEWIAYQRAVGFDRVLVYDHGSKDGTHDILARICAIDPAVAVVPWFDTPELQSPQEQAYNDAISRTQTEWIAFFDADEFLVLYGHSDVKSLLASMPRSAGAVAVNWRIFGSSGRDEPGEGFVIERFVRCADGRNPHRTMCKSIVRRNAVARMTVHSAKLREGKYVDAAGAPTSLVNAHRTENCRHDYAALHHYVLKSRTEFLEKLARGRADRAHNATDKYQSRTDPKYWTVHDCNDVENLDALRWREAVVSYLKKAGLPIR